MYDKTSTLAQICYTPDKLREVLEFIRTHYPNPAPEYFELHLHIKDSFTYDAEQLILSSFLASFLEYNLIFSESYREQFLPFF